MIVCEFYLEIQVSFRSRKDILNSNCILGAAWTIGFVLEKIISNLTAMNSEPTVVQDTVKLLVAMVDSKERGRQVLKSPVLNNLAICVQNHGIDELPSEAKRGLLKALTTVTSSCEDQAAKDAHWNKILQPLIERYNALVCRPDLKTIYNDEKFRHQVVRFVCFCKFCILLSVYVI